MLMLMPMSIFDDLIKLLPGYHRLHWFPSRAGGRYEVDEAGRGRLRVRLRAPRTADEVSARSMVIDKILQHLVFEASC